ncbi:MAG: dihydroxyacetone kinase subunit DhaL [Lactobacillus iners]|uniref:dihydroxyacetone kinase subunit DhaL n=1 Tax=Lactobacillus iners TaxID=147802 RepID=UPI000C9C33D8|nr:dihydroxyacetone kinase subunit DhaL [Lactobacillus iners]MCT7669970.1 dihydroxyacetone kinase subunit DhaL [Lactobacillus iners]MCT7706204.1 dihydroxyacetone kinase subunit DhaL [Lactobacillus iners]MCT7779147.1 dihydroxyacetone kinase subunit DhaL [Lactobacillus iners]MDK8317468.1 dihydroxyacetone kinase subunit DhaL [Lactobacillus iners]MDK8325021.1 dihydroxyacetone kinase subunit DhaL [Lactobacillus iners]
MELDATQLKKWMELFSKKITANEKYLCELDAPIGDSDHGFNMKRGMDAVVTKLNSAPDELTICLKTIAMALISTVGGASGPLYGTAFLEMAKESTKNNNIVDLLEAALAGIKKRGGATTGDKTMVDVWSVVIEAIKQDALTTEKIEAAVLATKDMIAKKGRASYLGERSINHIDPGSQSSGYLFESLLEVINNK